MENRFLKVLVVDDTVVYRKVVSDILKEIPGIEVVGIANNGRIALAKIDRLKPNLLILDIEMPEMNGLEVLSHIKKEGLDIGAIMLSTLTKQGGEITMKSLELGAFDFITKPQEGNLRENRDRLKNIFIPMLKAFKRRVEIRNILKGKRTPETGSNDIRGFRESADVVQRINTHGKRKKSKSKIVAIGISTGGPNALSKMLPELPGDLNVPILVVQHMPPIFTKSLAMNLNLKCKLEVREAGDGEPIQANTIFIAPGGKQMKVAVGLGDSDMIIRITDDPPENSCKPSVDYLFRSIAKHYTGRNTGVIMTGMGADGAESIKLMKENGSTIIAQNEATCVVYGMPKEPINAGIADVISPLNKISEEICRTVR